MFKSRGYSAHRLLILFTSGFVVLMIVTVFISYSADWGREARINMLKVTQMQLQSANRMLLSRATILNLQFQNALDATAIDKSYKNGLLTYGELVAKEANIPIFITVNQLILEEDNKQGKLRFYPQGLRGKKCFLSYLPPRMWLDNQGERHRRAARYELHIEQC